MGSLNSTLTSDQVLAGTAVAAVVAVSAAMYGAKPPSATPSTTGEEGGAAGKKRQRKRGKAGTAGDGTPPSLAASAALFSDAKDAVVSSAAEENMASSKGSLQVPGVASKKKRKVKSATATPNKSDEDEKTPEPQQRASSSQHQGAASSSSASSFKASGGKRGGGGSSKLAASTASVHMSPSMDASWTRVDARKSTRSNQHLLSGSEADAAGASGEVSSDAGVTTSATGDDETDEPKTLAERLVPKPPKTDVDDMLPADPGLARVMRIGGQAVPEKPSGISWRDYEDADELQQSTDADAEDEGWGIVQGKKPRPQLPSESAGGGSSSASSSHIYPSTISDAEIAKRQRQREARREAGKAAKAEGEEERLATLARYRREQEKARMDAQAKKGKTSKLSGGMTASVQNGALVWE